MYLPGCDLLILVKEMTTMKLDWIVTLPDLFQSWQPLHLKTTEVSEVLLCLGQALEELLLASLPFWSWMGYLKT